MSHLPLLASSNELPLASCVKPALGLDECYVEPHWTVADRKEHLALLLEFLADREPSAVFYRAPAPAPGPSPAPAPAPSPSIFEAEAPPFYRGLRPRTPEAFAPPYQRGSGRKRLRHRDAGWDPHAPAPAGWTYAANAPCPAPAGGWEADSSDDAARFAAAYDRPLASVDVLDDVDLSSYVAACLCFLPADHGLPKNFVEASSADVTLALEGPDIIRTKLTSGQEGAYEVKGWRGARKTQLNATQAQSLVDVSHRVAACYYFRKRTMDTSAWAAAAPAPAGFTWRWNAPAPAGTWSFVEPPSLPMVLEESATELDALFGMLQYNVAKRELTTYVSLESTKLRRVAKDVPGDIVAAEVVSVHSPNVRPRLYKQRSNVDPSISHEPPSSGKRDPTWGFDGHTLYVVHGLHAEFRVTYLPDGAPCASEILEDEVPVKWGVLATNDLADDEAAAEGLGSGVWL